MTLYRNGAEGLATGTGVTTANSGGASGDAFDSVSIGGGSIAADDTRASNGTKSYKVTPGNSASNSVSYTKPGSNHVAIKAKVWFSQAVGTGMNLLWLGIGTTRLVNIELRPSAGGNKIRLNDASGATSAVYTSTSALPFNAWVRVELDVYAGTTASNGRIRFAMYLGDSITPIDTVYDSSALNTGTAAITTGRWGAFGSTTDVTPFWLDDLAFDDAAAGFIGPNVLTLSGVVTPAPATVGNVLTLTLTTSGENANPLSYSCVWDGTSMGPQASNVFTHTDSTPGTKNWSATVTQSA